MSLYRSPEFLVCLVGLEKTFNVFPMIYLWEGVANLDQRGMVVWIFVGDH